jgi:superfamily II DNA or RNA helicase
MKKDYTEFLSSKFKFSKSWGFEVAKRDINPLLKPHQKDLVRWAVAKGRAAVFAAFGLGKTFIQLEVLRLLNEKDPGRYLIIAPLGVRTEFFSDADKLDFREEDFPFRSPLGRSR